MFEPFSEDDAKAAGLTLMDRYPELRRMVNEIPMEEQDHVIKMLGKQAKWSLMARQEFSQLKEGVIYQGNWDFEIITDLMIVHKVQVPVVFCRVFMEDENEWLFYAEVGQIIITGNEFVEFSLEFTRAFIDMAYRDPRIQLDKAPMEEVANRVMKFINKNEILTSVFDKKQINL